MTPWPGLLRAAMAIGIAPEAFWRLSLCEWRAISGGGGEVLGRGGFDELLRRYPDD